MSSFPPPPRGIRRTLTPHHGLIAALALAAAIGTAGCRDSSTPVAPDTSTAIASSPTDAVPDLTAGISSSQDSVAWHGNVLEYTDGGDQIRWVRDQQHAQLVHAYRNGVLEFTASFRDEGGQASSVLVSNPSGDTWFEVDASGSVIGSSDHLCSKGICPEFFDECATHMDSAIGSAAIFSGAVLIGVVSTVISVRLPSATKVAKVAFATAGVSAVDATQHLLTHRACRQRGGGGDDEPKLPCRPGDDCEIQVEGGHASNMGLTSVCPRVLA